MAKGMEDSELSLWGPASKPRRRLPIGLPDPASKGTSQSKHWIDSIDELLLINGSNSTAT